MIPVTETPPFDTVLVANRGEIARRIIRTLRVLGIRSVAVYSDGDADAPHVREADESVRIGPDPASESYLRTDAVIAAAVATGSDAIHPGYGFLSESVELARACIEAGIVFVGPGIRALEIAGDKARAREHMSTHGVPIIPGFDAAGLDDEQIAARADEVGFPLLVKPSAGGGGKGMEIVADAAGLPQALASARRVARAAFGDDALILERLISTPRHIEVQVFGDTHGEVVAYGERECTLQRRHQKVIEESPAPGLSEGIRARLAEAAIAAARSVDYVGAGTVEFLVDKSRPEEFFFIEMNTRLQVEHPVTEAVTDLDLVALQLEVAAGGRVAEAPEPRGHAIEARVYAESPEKGFLPSVGRVLAFREPEGVRTDAAVESGSEVSASYDPMIAKVIAHAPSRAEALSLLDAALTATVVLGVETNIGFLRALCADERVQAGDMDTGLIETLLPFEPGTISEEALAAAARVLQPADAASAPNPWQALRDWRLTGPVAPHPQSFLTDTDAVLAARVHIRDETAVVDVGLVPDMYSRGSEDGGSAVAAVADDGVVWVSDGGRSIRLRPLTRRQALKRRLAALDPSESAQGPDCLAPMPGAVVALHVEDGVEVRKGDRLVSIEAMKMEHPVLAPHDGVVQLLVAVGDQVRVDQPVARVPHAPTGAEPTPKESS